MRIKSLEFKNSLLLAPMAGVTDVAFREICIDLGADAGVTEMISAKALMYDNQKTIELLHTASNEKIKIVQIFGHEPDVMANACISPYLEKFDIIDINMGCPAPKIVGNGDGSFLMTNINLAREIITECVKVSKKPITVKFRSGFTDDKINAVEFAKMCEEAGASAITIHGRTRSQMYSGKVDLDIIKNVKSAVNIPVIASGDIIDKESLENTKSYTNCDGFMIGRGALGNPNIFADLTGNTQAKKIDIIHKHIEKLRELYPENFVNGHIRKHLLWYLKGEKNVSDLKVKVATIKDLNEVVKIMEEYFENSTNL